MGRQIEFFLAWNDIKDILSFIEERGDVLLSRSLTPIHSTDEEFRSAFFNQFGLQAYIWNNQLLPPEINKRTGFIGDAEVIEFLSGECHAGAKRMLPGRLYIDMFYLKNNEIQKKDGKLMEIYDIYRRYILKTYKKSTNIKPYYYIAPKAYEFYQTGWKAMAGELVEVLF